MIAGVIPLDFRGLIGREDTYAAAMEERQWYYAALVWCYRNRQPVEVAQRAFMRTFYYPPKRWWSNTQSDPYTRVPLAIAQLCSELSGSSGT